MAGETYIAGKQLLKVYKGRVALSIDNLEIHRGEVFGLIGPNGAGKSTFISILATLLKPTSGDVIINGHSVVSAPRHIRPRIGYVPQELALYPMLSAEQNLLYWAGIHRIPKHARKAAVADALAMVHLLDRAKDLVSTFSGGMKRRLNLVAAIMHNPELLIMDEPTAGVDVKSRKCMSDIIERFRNNGKTVLFTSHYIDELETICDRLAVLNHGKIQWQGSLAEILSNAGKPSLESIMLDMEEEG